MVANCRSIPHPPHSFHPRFPPNVWLHSLSHPTKQCIKSHNIQQHSSICTAQFNVHKSTAFYFLQSGFSLVKWLTAYQYFEIILPLKYCKVNEGHICKS
jgi:hypothetical protein